MSEITETVTVQNGQAAMKTVAVSGTLSPKSSATDVVTTVETSDGKQAALKVYNINGGGGGGGNYDAEIESLENAVSVLTTSVELSTEIGQTTTVLLDELLTLDVDGRPDYKAPGATVYAENGVTGIIDTIDNSMQTAIVKTVSVSTGGGASGDYLSLSGGEVSGNILMTQKSKIIFGGDTQSPQEAFAPKIGWKSQNVMVIGDDTLRFNTGQHALMADYDNSRALGTSSVRWKNIYTTKINNGEDIAIPTEGGTMARLEDLDNILEIEEF